MLSNVIIGLEIHIELRTKSKMFCHCRADYFGRPPNSCVCPICLGLPGALPFANQKAIEWTVIAGLALNCQINSLSKFDRKNYFYPDLPKGYQISQYDLPLCQKGEFHGIRIRRIHLEEDTGKLFHQAVNGQRVSLIDFNRSGVPLMEIVTEPDLRSAFQAKDFLKNLQRLVRFLGIADADMEKGQMRCEPTVNLEIKKDDKIFYTPLVELKNINSFRFVEKAINYEVERQLKEFKKTGVVKREGNKTTRGWDEKNQRTVLQREKEEASDYRYFPEPDIPPIKFDKSQIANLKSQIVELPEQKAKRFIKDYHLSDYYAEILTENKKRADYFEKAVFLSSKEKISPTEIANAMINKKIDIDKTKPEDLIEQLIKQKNIVKMNMADLLKIIQEVLKNNQKAVDEYQKGKLTVIEFLVGQVMAETKGQADPQQIRETLREKLKSS